MRVLVLGLLLGPNVIAQLQPLTVIPRANQTEVPTNARILIRYGAFGEAFDAFQLSESGRRVNGTLIGARPWLIFIPSAPLLPSTTYNLAVNLPNNLPYSGRFTTGAGPDNTPPTIVSDTPGQRRDGSGLTLEIRFSKPMDPSALFQSPVLRILGGTPNFDLRPELSRDATTLTLSPGYASYGQVFALNFRDPPGVFDWTGNQLAPLAGDLLISTYPRAPRAAPALTLSVPEAGESQVPTNNSILLGFSANLSGDEATLARAVEFRDQDDQAVPFRIDKSDRSLDARYLVIRPTQLLRGNRGYRLRVSGLYDEFANAQNEPVTLEFRTALLPELSAFRLVAQPGAGLSPPYPSNLQFRWTYSRSLALFLEDPQSPPLNALALTLSADRRHVDGTASGPGPYRGSFRAYDRVEIRPQPTGYNWSLQREPDNTPPEIRWLTPGNESQFPVNGRARVVFTEPVTLLEEPVLLRDGRPIPADIVLSAMAAELRPRSVLEAGANYWLRIPPARDAAGNLSAPAEVAFQAIPAYTEPFQIVRVTPDRNALDVDRAQPLVFEFNRPPEASSLAAISVGAVTFGGSLPDRWLVNGNTATYQPDPRWPRGSFVSWNANSVVDWAGVRVVSAGAFGRFITRDEAADATPLRILSSSVTEGEVLSGDLGTEVDILFRVSAPVNPATLASGNVTVLEDGRSFSFLRGVTYDAAARGIRVRMEAFASRRYTVKFSSGILSEEEEPMEPFTLNFSRALPRNFGSNDTIAIVEFEPDTNSGIRLQPNGAIVLYFAPGIRRALVDEGLVVRVNGFDGSGVVSLEIPFDREWAPDESAVTIRPRVPLQENQSVTVLLSRLPWGINRIESRDFSVDRVFTPPVPPPGTWPVLRPSPGSVNGVPLDASIDVEFARDIPDSVLSTVTAFFWEGTTAQTRPIGDLRVSRVSARVLRLQPVNPPPPNQLRSYAIRFGSEIVYRNSLQFGSRAARQPAGDVVSFPWPGASDVPMNADFRVVFPVPVNQLAGTLYVESGGRQLPLDFRWGNNDKLATVRRNGLWQANASYTLVLENMEDITGRRIPDRRIAFTTGGRTERAVSARLLSWEPTGTNVSRDAEIRLYLDRPLFVDQQGNGIYDWLNSNIGGWIDYLDNGRVLRFVPDGPLPAQTLIEIPVPNDRGNAVTFSTGAELTASPPQISLVTPYRDATGVPLDALIQFRFSAPVLASTLNGITLLAGGQPLAARPELDSDGRTVTLRPQLFLPRSAQIEVRIAGVKNTNGALQEGESGWTFQTAATHVPAPLLEGSWNAERRVVEFTAPLNPFSVTDSSCNLQERGVYRVAVRAELSADGRQLRCAPAVPLRPDSEYVLSITGVRSWAGRDLGQTTFFLPAADSLFPLDRQPPQLISVLPREGEPLDPSYSVLFTFDEPTRLVASQLSLWRDDRPVAFSLSNASFGPYSFLHAVQPVSGWLPNRSYRLQLSGATDLDGNVAAPREFTFQTGPLAFASITPLRLISTTPANGSVGVDPATPITFAFDRPVVPQREPYSVSTANGQIYSLPIRFGLSGNEFKLQAPAGWPPSTQLFARISVRDHANQGANPGVSFTTAAPTDQTPPRLELLSPLAGNTLPAGPTRFIARFDEAVTFRQSPIEMTAPGISSIQVGSPLVPVAGDGRVLIWVAHLPPGATISVKLQNLSDLSGNAIEPKSFTYVTLPLAASPATPQLLSTVPERTGWLTGLSPIVLRFSHAMDENSLVAGLQLQHGIAAVRFTLQSAEEGRVWSLTPAEPWRSSRSGSARLILASTIYSRDGLLLPGPQELSWSVVDARAPLSGPAELTAYFASETAIDLLFDRPLEDLPAEPFGVRLGHQRVPVLVKRMSERWLQLVPAEPLQLSEAYRLMLGPALEMPLRWTPAAGPASGADATAMKLPQPYHRFRLADLSCRGTIEALVPAGAQEVTELFVAGAGRDLSLDCRLPAVPAAFEDAVRVVLRK